MSLGLRLVLEGRTSLQKTVQLEYSVHYLVYVVEWGYRTPIVALPLPPSTL